MGYYFLVANPMDYSHGSAVFYISRKMGVYLLNDYLELLSYN